MGIGIVKVRPAGCLPLLALVAALAVDHREADAQAAASASADRFLGAWELVDWRTTDGAGTVRFPYSEGAQGQITYSADGRMSAHLMRPPEDPADAPPQYLGYWGTFSLQPAEGTVTHHVIGSTQENWIGSDQVRRFSFEGDDRLVLALGSNRLTWERVR